MKFSRLVLAVLFAAGTLTFTTSCSSDNDAHDDGVVVTYDELPGTSKVFIGDHFKSSTVTGVRKKADSYDVSLLESQTRSTAAVAIGYEVKFDLSGVWLEMEAHNDGPLPENVLALVPRPIISYLAQNYPGRSITEIDKVYQGYKVELVGADDAELLFDLNGVYKGNSGGNSSDKPVNVNDLPAPSKSFLTTHFAGVNVTSATKDNEGYDVKLANTVEIDFDLQGQWIEIDANNTTLPASVLALLPQGITTYLNTNYPSKRVEDIAKKPSSYKIELAGDIELSFDTAGNLWGVNNNNNSNNGSSSDQRVTFESLPSASKTLLQQHFLTTTTVLYIEKDTDEYDVRLADGSDVTFDLAGNLKSVEVLPGKQVPTALIPAKISAYLTTNYATKKVIELEVKPLGYKIDLSGYPQLELLFDANGEFKGFD